MMATGDIALIKGLCVLMGLNALLYTVGATFDFPENEPLLFNRDWTLAFAWFCAFGGWFRAWSLAKTT